MSERRIRQKVTLRCPIGVAEARVAEFFQRRNDADGKARLALRVPLERRGPFAGLALEHDVAVTARKGRDDRNLNDVIRIAWEPVEGRAYPAFAGTLAVWAEGDPEKSFVELDGTYQPPGGLSGQAFDEAFGQSIARRTARALLHDIARAVSERSTLAEGSVR